MPNWKKVIVSGSDAALNSLNVTSLLSVTGSSNLTGSLDISGSASILGNTGTTTFYTNADTLIFTGSVYLSGSIYQTGSLNVTGITSSLFGTASWAQNAITASHSVSALSASYALTASYALNGGSGGGGGVFSYHQTASAVTWSVTHNLNTYTPIVQVYDEDYNQLIPASISGSSVNTVQITFAIATTGYAVLTTGGNVNINISGSNATLVQSTPATTWSFYHGLNETYPVFTIFDNNDDVIVPLRIHAENANTASIYFSTARTGTAVAANCGLSGSTFESASWAATASYFVGTVTSASYATFAQTSATASYVLNAVSASYSISSSFAQTAYTASYAVKFNASQSFTASGLNYPTADNGEESFIQTDGAGTLSLQYVKTIYEEIYNGEATNILKGTPVYVSGSVGAAAVVYRADAGNPAKMPVVYISADTIAPGATGRGIALGLIKGVNTTGYPAGTEIYIAVGGGWTSIRPTGSATIQVLGYVTKEGAGGQGVVLNPGPSNLPNLNPGSAWVGGSNSYPVAVPTSSFSVASAVSASYSVTSSYANTATSASYALTSSYLNPITSGYIVLTQVSQSLNYVDDADAAANGVPLGGLYRNGNFIAIRIV